MLQSDRFFEDQEYILADSAYTLSRTVIPAYKENDPNAIIPINQRRRFSRELSKMRVGIEHTIGMLKSRFQSLRGLRNLISNRRTLSHVLFHVRACIVLHNMLMGQHDDTYWDEYNMDQLRVEWEAEAIQQRLLIDRQSPEGDYSFFTEAGNEDQREAMRYRFQLNEYSRPYTQEPAL